MYTASENGEEGGKEAVESEEDFIATWRNLVASAATHSQVALAAQVSLENITYLDWSHYNLETVIENQREREWS